MIPQFIEEKRHRIDFNNFSLGITLFIFGLFKKVVIADYLSPVVSDVFSRINTLSMLDAWVGVIAYTFQLYFDFSAYSEMSIGLGKMMNIDFPTNFDSPYQATSIIDFWRRWHVTLGSWIKNYIYIPLGGNRKGITRKLLNLFIAMAICGFWHGAGFRYIAWGMLHGGFLVINHLWREFAKKHNLYIPSFLGAIITFICVCSGWAIFRANSLIEGLRLIKKMFNVSKFVLPAGGKIENVFSFLHYFGIQFINTTAYPYAILLLLLVIVICIPSAQRIVIENFKPTYKWLILTFVCFIWCLYTMSGNADLSEFLYFQF